jgi:DNA polymerase elongation subunit (family B)
LKLSSFFPLKSIIDPPLFILNVRKKEFPSFKMNKGGSIIDFNGKKLDNFNKALKRGVIAIAPCGTVFSTGKTGVMADIERSYFFKRQEVKDDMRKQIDKNREDEMFMFQWALKIFLNAMFGITAVPYSRYFNKHMSEAITSCARHTIRQGENFINDILNNPYSNNEITKLINKNHPVSAVLLDYIKYIDTDSLFVDIGSFFKQYGVNLDENENRIEIILNCAKIILDYVNKRTYEETQLIDYNSQVKDFKIMFEQEIVAKSALFVKKKKYALHVVNDDNKPTDKIKIKGLEIIRSETPEAIKNRLKEIMNMILVFLI